ncbi:glycoside hydrolase family 88 protein [Chitinophagaceae bacterium LB-8]|uniref:Glycoside hydrolase family 88 protein n=1 Tax=Paraflavisolibacter caeni TaxID=2982496 RepID=A0A9X2XZM9_9BACT|nr:glycoside hydrolase family 88 protein [Paraflavisolibacter caeni]MCU7552559.1 glycoside hydrolase family 88 protein [Paraflavisolibacter caeni]
MNTAKNIRFIFCAIALTASLLAGAQRMDKLIARDMKLAVKQYKLLAAKTPADSMPRHYDPRKLEWVNSDTKWWCSGFFPGSLWLIYEYTKDEAIRKEAEQRLAILEKEKHYTGNHDLGFMMYCSFGNAYRITGNPLYKPTIDTSAMSLATRYRPAIQSIQSWDSNDKLKCPVIIDNMMNLELLYWVAQHGGDNKLKEIALTHANSTLARHFRPDGSSYHVLDYDPATSQLIRKLTWQGTADESAWSRGQSWGLYGFTMMYRFTKDVRYLEQAKKIAGFIFNHPNMPADLVPYWDFNAPGIPNAYRDASSAAINASALLELAQYVGKEESNYYLKTAEKIIRSLSSKTYLAKSGANGGYLLMHNVGNLPFHSEIDTTLTYADYYFLEALIRYQQWILDKKFPYNS